MKARERGSRVLCSGLIFFNSIDLDHFRPSILTYTYNVHITRFIFMRNFCESPFASRCGLPAALRLPPAALRLPPAACRPSPAAVEGGFSWVWFAGSEFKDHFGKGRDRDSNWPRVRPPTRRPQQATRKTRPDTRLPQSAAGGQEQ